MRKRAGDWRPAALSIALDRSEACAHAHAFGRAPEEVISPRAQCKLVTWAHLLRFCCDLLRFCCDPFAVIQCATSLLLVLANAGMHSVHGRKASVCEQPGGRNLASMTPLSALVGAAAFVACPPAMGGGEGRVRAAPSRAHPSAEHPRAPSRTRTSPPCSPSPARTSRAVDGDAPPLVPYARGSDELAHVRARWLRAAPARHDPARSM